MNWIKKISPLYLILLIAFYVAWGNFWTYQSFYNHDESLLVPFKMVDGLAHLEPIYFKIWDGFREWMTYKELLRPIIYFAPLLAALLFFHFFEKEKKIPWASVILIFGPFIFYNLSLNDYRLSLLMVWAVLFLALHEKVSHLRGRNLLLIIMLLVGVLIDYSFLLMAMVELFSNDKKVDRIARGFFALVLLGVILYYQQSSMGLLKSKVELLYDQKNLALHQNIFFYFNAMVDFMGGAKSLGLAFAERKVVVHDLAMKLMMIFSVSGFMLRFYRKYVPGIVVVVLSTLIVAGVFTSSSMAIILAGNYLSTIAFKGSFLFPAFLLMCHGLSKLEAHQHRLTLLAVFLVLLSWMNVLNNAQNNITHIHRTENPVFWGLIQNSHLKLNSSFTQAYPAEVKALHPDDRLFVDGLKNINIKVYQEYQLRRGVPATLLDSFVYSQTGYFLKALDNLGVLQQNGAISNRAFLEYAGKINSGFETKLENTIYPLIYELLYKADGYNLAEKVYLLALFQYSNMGNDEIVRMLIHEFGAVFKTKK